MKAFVTALVAVLSLVGCRHPDAPAYPDRPGGPAANKVAFADATTRTAVGATIFQEVRQPDGRLQVFLGMRNNEQHVVRVEMTCEFKDAQGLISEVSAPETVQLGVGENATKIFTSRGSGARDYLVRLRRGR